MFRTKMSLVAALIGATLLLSFIPAQSATIAGTKCTKLNSTKMVADTKFTCVKSGKKLVWNKGVILSKVTQIAPPASGSYNPIGSINGACPSVNNEADALIKLANKEIQNNRLPDFVTLEIEPGALTETQEKNYRIAIAAATRFADPSVPIKYFIPKSKAWFSERWPNDDFNYLNQVTTDARIPFPAHSLGDKIRYAVAGAVDKANEPYEYVQIVSIVLKPVGLNGNVLHWYGHPFGGPYGAAVSEALGIACYKAYRGDVLRFAKELGIDLRKNEKWDAPQSGWYQGFLATEYLTGKLGITPASKLMPDSLNRIEIDANFIKSLGMNLDGFYEFIAKRLAQEYANI